MSELLPIPPANNFHAPHIKNARDLLAHRSQFHLKSFVDKSINDPTHCVSILNQLLAKEPERVTGFVELGGLNHFNTFLKAKQEQLPVLQILAHPNFPFYYEHIESSGLAQTLFELQQKRSPLQQPAKRVIDIWREKHAKSKQKKRKRKVKFVDERRLTTAVKFEQSDPVSQIRRSIAKLKRTTFRPSVKWRIPFIIRESAVATLKINQKIKSEAKAIESTRQRTILEETITRATHSPAEHFTPGVTKKETIIIPNEDKPALASTPMNSMASVSLAPPPLATIRPLATIPPAASVPYHAQPSPVHIINNQTNQLKRPFPAIDNQKVVSLFRCLDDAGFPNPAKRMRFNHNPPQGHLQQAQYRQPRVPNLRQQPVIAPRGAHSFDYAPNYPPKQDYRSLGQDRFRGQNNRVLTTRPNYPPKQDYSMNSQVRNHRGRGYR